MIAPSHVAATTTDRTGDSELLFAAEMERLDRQPFAEGVGYRDLNPITPAGEIQWAGDIAPYPGGETAAELSAHYLADSYAAHGLGRHLMAQIKDMATAPVEQVQDMADAYERFSQTFALGFLLRHVTDEVAAELVALLDSDVADELTWDWLEDAGINPYLIRSHPGRAERVAAGENARAAVAAMKGGAL